MVVKISFILCFKYIKDFPKDFINKALIKILRYNKNETDIYCCHIVCYIFIRQ